MKALRAAALLCSLLVSLSTATQAANASPLNLSGNMLFSSLDGSSQDADGTANGVFTVNGDLVLDGTINCNDDSPLPTTASACAMRITVSGNLTLEPGSGLFAENRRSSGNGGNISLTVGGDMILRGKTVSLPGAVVSSSRSQGSSGTAGDVSADVSGAVTLEPGSAIAASAKIGNAGTVRVTAGGVLQVGGLIAAGAGRTVLPSLLTGEVLEAGSSGQAGGLIVLRSHASSGTGILIQSGGIVVSQGEGSGGRLVFLEACGIEVRGLVASLSKNNGPSQVVLRSGKGILVDGRDLDGVSPVQGRFGLIRGDGTLQGAAGYLVDLFAQGDIQVLGPESGSITAVNSTAGLQQQRFAGGTITAISLGGTLTASGNAFTAGRSRPGNQGGAIDLRSRGDVTLDTAVLRAIGDYETTASFRRGGSIAVRSYQGNVSWTFGIGDVRPTGSGILRPAERGTISLTACGQVDFTGTQFPVLGNPVAPFPVETEGVCSPAAPSLPSGEPTLQVCNRLPTADGQSATTKEDTPVTLTLTGSDPDGNPLTFSIVTPPAHGTLGALTSPTSTSVQAAYTPAADFNGSDSFTFRVDDGQGGQGTATVNLTVTPVNDVPSFAKGPDQTVAEDAGPQTVNPWATAISAGASNEASQVLSFQVTGNSNPSLFSVAPAVSSSGVLTYTLAPGAAGSATITLVLHDDGGTADGGVDTSAPQSFTISILTVNHPPTFIKGPDVTVLEDAGPRTVSPWATAISSGPPSESSQAVSFLITGNTNPGLFSAGPAVSPAGVLTFTPAPDANGTASITLVAKDDGGTANGGNDTSGPQTFTITVSAVNDVPSFTKGPDVTVLEDSGSQTVNPWATAISVGPANESTQAVSFLVTGNTAPGLFSAGPAVSPAGVLTFTPAPNAFGTATITLVVKDDGGTADSGVDTSGPQTFTITVTPVNDVPSFTKGPDASAFDNAGPATVSPWATAISAGPNEPGQVLDFQVVSNSNPGIFAAGPSVSPAGVLTFTPAQVPAGTSTATIVLQLHDDGGTANGGINTSGTQSFVISITHVNNPPHLVASPKETFDTIGNTLLEVDSTPGASDPKVTLGGSLLANFTDSDGPSPLSVSLVSSSAGASVTINPDGSFTYLPPAGGTGDDTFTYSVSDGQDTVTRTVTVHRISRVWYVKNDAAADGLGRSVDPFDTLAEAQTASAVNDTIFVFTGDGSTTGQNAGIVLKNGQRLIGQGAILSLNVGLNGNAAPTKLLDAGSRPLLDGNNAVSATDAIPAEIAGLSLAGTANGIDVTTTDSFTGSGTLDIHNNLVRSAGQEGIDINAGGTGTLTLRLQQNDLTSGGTGLDVQRTAGAVVISALDGNTVREATGGSGIVITGPVTFDTTPGGALDPVSGGITNIGIPGNGVGGAGLVVSGMSGTLTFNALGVFADGGAGVRVAGTGVATAGLTVNSGMGTVVAAGGPALDLSGLTANLQQITLTSTNSATTGVALNSIAGTVTAGSGSSIGNITSAAGTAFQVGGSNATINYAGTISTTTGKGVELTSNAGSTIDLTGTLTLSTGLNPAFTATGGGTVTATNTSNTLTTTTGTALNVANTTIGASGLKFRSISAGTAVSGLANGIILNNTGSSGGLTVSGAGAAGSGGTIRKGVTGISLTSTSNVVLNWMQLNDFTDFAIRGSSVNGFSLSNSTINGVNGDNDVANEGSISFDECTGSASLTNVNISGGWEDNFRLANTTGTLNRLSLTNCNIGSNSASFGNSALNIAASGTAVVKVTVTGSTFTGSRSHFVQFLLNGSSTPNGDFVFTSNTITQSMAAVSGAGNIFISSGGSGNPTLTYNIQGNTMRNAVGNAINVSKGSGTGSFNGTIDGNIIGVSGIANSGSSQGNGIAIIHVGGGTHTTHITNNTIRHYNNDGILVQVGDNTSGGNGTVNATITGNTVKEPDSFALHGLELNIGTTAGDSHFVCASIGGAGLLKNDVTGAGNTGNGGFEMRPRQRQSTTIRLPGYGGALNDTVAVASFLAGQNTTSGTASISASAASNGFVNGAACP